jgi:hypothetical protein
MNISPDLRARLTESGNVMPEFAIASIQPRLLTNGTRNFNSINFRDIAHAVDRYRLVINEDTRMDLDKNAILASTLVNPFHFRLNNGICCSDISDLNIHVEMTQRVNVEYYKS